MSVRSYDVTELVDFVVQPNGSIRIDPSSLPTDLHGLLMCPNCGWCYPARVLGLVPDHELELPSELCPGSGQVPRNPESDRRPLWNLIP